LDPVYYNASFLAPASWPIQVNEKKKTVTAAAGVPQRILLDSLDQYTYVVHHPASPPTPPVSAEICWEDAENALCMGGEWGKRKGVEGKGLMLCVYHVTMLMSSACMLSITTCLSVRRR
jgi:hypothetical protein